MGIDDYGDPESVFCRWHDGIPRGKVWRRGARFCEVCDSPSPKDGLPPVVATWDH